MFKNNGSLLAIVAASILSLTFSFLKVPNTFLQSITAIMFVVLIVTLSRIFFKHQKTTLPHPARLALLFTSAQVIQLLVLSTGGLYSPLLILIHIFTLGASFLVSLPLALIFLGLSVGLIIANTIFKPELLQLFTSDPWSAILYIITFLIIIPLSQLLAKSYYLKDTISKVLSEYIQMEELKSQSILTSLNDLVVVVDKDLKIISFNSSAEKTLGLSKTDVVGREVLSILPLKDRQGRPLTASSLNLDQVIVDGASRIIEDLKLYPKGETHPRSVRINVRPVIDSLGHTSQIILVISTLLDEPESGKRHLSLLQAQIEYYVRLDEIRNNLPSLNPAQLRAKIEILNHLQEDLALSQEIQDHPLKPTTSLENIMTLSQQLVSKKAAFAQIFGVPLKFVRPEISNVVLGVNTYLTVPVDTKWLSVIVEKLIEMSILLSVENHSTVTVTVGPNSPARIEISCKCQLPENTQPQQLMSMYYPGLNHKTSLRYGSGLEGFIAATLVSEMGINLDIKVTPLLIFIVTLSERGESKG